MNTVQIQKTPWVSILPQSEMQTIKNENDVLSLVKLLLKVSQEAIECYESGKYKSLDALVGNYGCEVHAFNICCLAHSTELKEECKTMIDTCGKIQKLIDDRQSIQNQIIEAELSGPPNKIYETIQKMSEISEEMMYLIRSRILTITKVDYPNGSQKSVPERLRESMELAKEFNPVIKRIVNIAQSKLSHESILLMAKKLEKLELVEGNDGKIIKRMMSSDNLCVYPPVSGLSSFKKSAKQKKIVSKTYSCSYYNAKALLYLIAELKVPLIIKNMKMTNEPEQLFAFQSNGKFREFEKLSEIEIAGCKSENPVIICVIKIKKEEWLQKANSYGLGNMILANIITR